MPTGYGLLVVEVKLAWKYDLHHSVAATEREKCLLAFLAAKW